MTDSVVNFDDVHDKLSFDGWERISNKFMIYNKHIDIDTKKFKVRLRVTKSNCRFTVSVRWDINCHEIDRKYLVPFFRLISFGEASISAQMNEFNRLTEYIKMIDYFLFPFILFQSNFSQP